jgi:hypothetical protein
VQQGNVETARLGDGLKEASLVMGTDVRLHGIEERVKDAPAICQVVAVREEVALVQVASGAGVYEIRVRVPATGGDRLVVVDGELAPNIHLGDAAVTATVAVSLPDVSQLGVRHRASIGEAQGPPHPLWQGGLQHSNFRLQGKPALVQPRGLCLSCGYLRTQGSKGGQVALDHFVVL